MPDICWPDIFLPDFCPLEVRTSILVHQPGGCSPVKLLGFTCFSLWTFWWRLGIILRYSSRNSMPAKFKSDLQSFGGTNSTADSHPSGSFFSPKWITYFLTTDKILRTVMKIEKWPSNISLGLLLTNIVQRSSRRLQRPSEDQSKGQVLKTEIPSLPQDTFFLSYPSLPFPQKLKSIAWSEKTGQVKNFDNFDKN